MVGNIKHKFSIAVESDNPVSRAIGILKVAQAFEKEGIHLASDLNTATSRQLAAASDADEVVNDTIVATMVESIPGVGQALPTREMGGLYPVPYPALRKLSAEEEIRGANFLEQTLGSVKDALKSFDKQVATASMDLQNAAACSTGWDAIDTAAKKWHANVVAAQPAGNIPGYEHNPMAQAEYFKANKPDTAPIFLRPAERPVSNNWPEPMPVGLTKTTLVVAIDEFGDNEPNYDYTVVGFSPRLERETTTGWHEMKTISLLSNVDGEEGPNNIRVEDLLAICADHLNSLQLAGKASYSHVDAHKSIIKALHHLHGLTVLQHVKPTDNNSPGE